MAAAAGNFFNKLTVGGLAFSALGYLGNEMLYDVQGGERAVIFDKFGGIQEEVKGEGMHFRIPYVQDPKIYSVRIMPKTIDVQTPSKDLQRVNATLRLLYRPSIDKLPNIFKNVGEPHEYAERVLPNIANEELKSIVAQFNAEELLTQRDQVSARLRSTMVERAKEYGLIFEDVALTHLAFDVQFEQAVERKQVAEQEAEMSRFYVEQAEFEATAKIIRAEGDSEAAMMIGKSITENGMGIIELRKIEAAKDIAQTMSRSRNVAYLPGNNNMLINMNMN